MTVKRFAAIDIGTNTILIVIAEMRRDGTFAVLDDLAEITRLEAVSQSRSWFDKLTTNGVRYTKIQILSRSS